MELNPVAEMFYHRPTRSFFRTFHGYEMQYFNIALGEWVTPEDAGHYPHEITAAADTDGNTVWTEDSLND